jgi:hypothetical protein
MGTIVMGYPELAAVKTTGNHRENCHIRSKNFSHSAYEKREAKMVSKP